MKENYLKTINCLDKGFVRLVDYMGDDAAIVQAARVSYGEGTKTIQEDSSLIRYLMRQRHTSPFEQVEFKFHVKAPIVVFRQWHRTRTASLNEQSARYSEMKDDFYVPELEEIRYQSKNNKQCRDDQQLNNAVEIIEEMKEIQQLVFKHYRKLLDFGLARELARINLPVSIYSEMYWKIDLHNLFHFLKLRLDTHAQKEIRVFADAMYSLIKPIVPVAIEAFNDYILNGITLSRQEKELFVDLLSEVDIRENVIEKINKLDISKREKNELKMKLRLEENK